MKLSKLRKPLEATISKKKLKGELKRFLKNYTPDLNIDAYIEDLIKDHFCNGGDPVLELKSYETKTGYTICINYSDVCYKKYQKLDFWS